MLLSHQSNEQNDTIAAIASAHGQGAVGVLRISGDDALPVLKKIFVPHRESFESHKMYYGKICDCINSQKSEIIDEVMVCFFAAPRSFTGGDCVEIYAHGGMFVLSEILSLICNNGARLAEPGEFTKRAFLNGRIDLAEAEAVMDLISAKTSVARRTAIRQLGGGLSHKIETARDTILSWIAHIELSIDYPEHEDEARNAAEILSECDNLIASLRRLHSTSRVGRIIRDGIRTAIIGRPNVGKSTLLNAILHEDRAIVHETAGTTRDVLTEHVRIADIALTIADTAGLRDTSDPIEKIGIEKTLAAACDAELILYVADATVGITDEDIEIIKGFGSPVIVLVNKSDLLLRDKTLGALPPMPPQGDEAPLTPYILEISAVTGEGIGGVFDCIKKLFLMGGVGEGGEEIIVRERHGELLLRAIEFVESAAGEICAGVPEDLVSVPLRAAYIALGEILGAEMGGDDIVDRIFSEFCLGK